jgi:DNA-binding beta-propeller fold protein YncE
VLVKYDIKGQRVFSMGPTIQGVEMRNPESLAVDDADNVYILDRSLGLVYILDRKGKPLGTFSFGETVRDSFAIAVESSGALLVVDRRQKTVYRYQ